MEPTTLKPGTTATSPLNLVTGFTPTLEAANLTSVTTVPIITTVPVATTLVVAAPTFITAAANIKTFAADKAAITASYASFKSSESTSTPEAIEAASVKQQELYHKAITKELSTIITAWRNNTAADKEALKLPTLSPDDRGDLAPKDHYGLYLAAAHEAIQAAKLTPEQIAQIQISPASDGETDALNTAMTGFEAVANSAKAARELQNQVYDKTIAIHADRKATYSSLNDSFNKAQPSLTDLQKFLTEQSLKDEVKGDTALNHLHSLLSTVLASKDIPDPNKEIFVRNALAKFDFINADPVENNKETEAGNILGALATEKHTAFKDIIGAEQKKYTDSLAVAQTQILKSATASPTTAGAAVDPNTPPVKVEIDQKTKDNVEKIKAAATLVGSVTLCATAACFFPPIGVLLIIAGASWFMNRDKNKDAKEAEKAAKAADIEEAAKIADPDRGLTAKEYLAKLEAEKAKDKASSTAVGDEADPVNTGRESSTLTENAVVETQEALLKTEQTLATQQALLSRAAVPTASVVTAVAAAPVAPAAIIKATELRRLGTENNRTDRGQG